MTETVGIENDARNGVPAGCPSLEELLPGPDLSGADGVLASHVVACPRCAEIVRAREMVARGLGDLPRAAAPRSGALDFALVMAAVDDRLEPELVRAEARWRPLVAPLPRAAMPAATALATLAALRTQPRLLGPARILPLLRHAAAFAAAAGVVAAALLARHGGSAASIGRFESESAQLTRGEPIGVELVDTVPGVGLRSIGSNGVPRLDPFPAARPPKTRGGP
jgi:hypothetical protein